MAQIKHFFLLQWKTYFRSISIKRKTQRRFFFIIFLYLPFLVFPFIQFLSEVKEGIIKENYENFMILLFGFLLYWILLPLMAKEIYLNLSVQKINIFPISKINLFIIRSLGTFIQPISWLGILGLFSLIYLSIFTKNPVFNSLSSILLSLIFFQVMLFISFISQKAGKIFFIMIILLISIINIRPVFSTSFFLSLKETIFPKLLVFFSLNHLFSLFFLLIFLIILIIINYFLFIKTCFKQISVKEKKTFIPVSIKIPGKLSGFIKKDISYFFKNRNYYITIFFTLLYFKYILLDKEPSEYSFFVLMFFMFIPSITFTLNIFGFDTSDSINRFIIFPVKGYQILLSKNISYTMSVIIQLSPFLIISLWKFGFNVFLFGSIQMFSMILIQISIGNHFSILNPEKFEFFRFNFGSLHMGFPLAFLYYISYIEVIRSIGVFRDTKGNGILIQFLFLLIYFIIYIFLLKYYGNKLDNNLEYVKDKLR